MKAYYANRGSEGVAGGHHVTAEVWGADSIDLKVCGGSGAIVEGAWVAKDAAEGLRGDKALPEFLTSALCLSEMDVFLSGLEDLGRDG